MTAEVCDVDRRTRKLWRDDRAASLQRVADLAGDRFSWLLQLGREVHDSDTVISVSGAQLSMNPML